MPELMVYMDSKFLFGETCCIFLQYFFLGSVLYYVFCILSVRMTYRLEQKKNCRSVFSLPRRAMLLGYYTYMRVFRIA